MISHRASAHRPHWVATPTHCHCGHRRAPVLPSSRAAQPRCCVVPEWHEARPPPASKHRGCFAGATTGHPQHPRLYKTLHVPLNSSTSCNVFAVVRCLILTCTVAKRQTRPVVTVLSLRSLYMVSIAPSVQPTASCCHETSLLQIRPPSIELVSFSHRLSSQTNPSHFAAPLREYPLHKSRGSRTEFLSTSISTTDFVLKTLVSH